LEAHQFKIINSSQQSNPLQEFKSRKIIDFGTGLLQEAKMYEVVEFNDRLCLKVDKLNEISQSQILKKQLWEALKRMFGI
jgi:hypothetical protein